MSDDDLAPGTVFTTPSKTLTDAHFLFFSGLTGDNHPIHYDVEYARATRFGKPLAHGLLLASLTALGASSAMHRIQGFVFVEQGSRFLRPVVVGDTISPRLTVERMWEEGGRRYVRFATALTNQRGETVLEGFHLYRVVGSAAPPAPAPPRPPGDRPADRA
jgi:acyl dehydratase